MGKHPRDQFISVYGRKPVKEVLENPDLTIDKVLMTKKSKGGIIQEIEQLCANRGVQVQRVSAQEVARLSKNPKQDQGIVADVRSPNAIDAKSFFEEDVVATSALLALDGITTPTNVGMIIRSATGLGFDGIVLPRKGNAKISPLVIKSSAGVLFKSRLIKCERLTPALKWAKKQGYQIYGLAGEQGESIYTADFYEKSIFVMGNESQGVSEATAELVDHWLNIPMANQVESLNVACAATVVGSELMRRR